MTVSPTANQAPPLQRPDVRRREDVVGWAVVRRRHRPGLEEVAAA